ncbi:DMT family transporter [Mycobacterium paraterrae]|uniref:DMT family transporter n=1 Tax=Mycobacterium paraterrae TaxID=577492 RepID=A0ABY3VIF8_9MYCO|nr:DMT family transporter [Mycobacterium paraterrae]UMB68242.1 DMT family transporter [Mycobacterium paraterrae]
MARTDIAALLALGSALCVAIGDVLQQRAAHSVDGRSRGHVTVLIALLRNQRWWWGALLLVVSIGLQAAALGQGSVLLVQALLTFSVLFALPINARLSRRSMSGSEWMWAGLLTAAVTVIVTLGSPRAGRSSASLHTWLEVACVVAPLLIVCVVTGTMRGGATAAVLFALASGSLWGIFAVLTKEVMARLGHGPSAVFTTPALYACILAAAGGVVLSQAAFRAGSLASSMPALQVSQPVVAAVLGVIVLGESLNTGWAGMIAIYLALALMAAAILRLARLDADAADQQLTERQRVPAA